MYAAPIGNTGSGSFSVLAEINKTRSDVAMDTFDAGEVR
jgi:hypothetical protein